MSAYLNRGIKYMKGVLMNTINKIVLVSVLCTSAMITYAAATNPPAPASPVATDISGTYNCIGSDPYSTPPDFKESILFKKNGDTYNVQMIHSNSILPYDFGTAIVNKDISNAISYVYWDPKNPSTMGTELLEIKSDGSLVGVYADHNKMKSGTETCTKASS
jgi:hypothetical protein